MSVHALLFADALIALFVVAIAVRPPMVVRTRWARQGQRSARVGVVVASASPLLWLAIAWQLPNGPQGHSVRWLFLGQWSFLSACMLVFAFAQYRVARLPADLN